MDKQRIGIVILAIAGVLALGLGLWRLNYNVKSPFFLKLGSFKPASQNSISVFDLQDKDTDKDGLSDFDELYIYKSSPYLEDSDSDGDSDYKEAQAGTDPNCPKGRACEAPAAPPEQPLIGSGLPNTPAKTSQLFGDTDTNDAETKELLSNLSIADIKLLLKSAGMTEEMLKKFDDETLMKIYKEALEKSQ